MNLNNQITKRIHKKKLTVKTWATLNGFSVKTTYELLYSPRYHGTFGIGAKIVRALHRDGYLTKAQFRRIPFKDDG